MNRHNIPIIVGISLPIIFIIIISLYIFITRDSIKPQFDFIFTRPNETDYQRYQYQNSYEQEYKIIDNRISLVPAPDDLLKGIHVYQPELYIYDVETDSTRVITLEEVQKLVLDPGPTSPDGYLVDYEYGHNGLFEIFGSDTSNQGYFISKGTSKKRIAVSNVNYYSDMGFIGWVK